MEFNESCRILRTAVAIEDRTARLTILIDPRKKALFERLCAEEDATPSQVLRRLIRRHIEERTGQPWAPPKETPEPTAARRATRRIGRI
jgi:hypothetical protein